MNSANLTSAELTALHTETLNEVRRARLLANITRRAALLFEVGYTAKETLTGLYVRAFLVTSPEGKTYPRQDFQDARRTWHVLRLRLQLPLL